MARSPRGFVVAWTLAVVVAAFTAIVAEPVHALPRQPDVILIITDDQRAGTLDWLPTVSRYMRRRGVIFTHAAVPTSVCCPSRASILTGQYAHTTKVWSNQQGWQSFVDAGMEPNTVAVWLSRAGYRTGLIGKYLNNFTGTGPPPGWTVWHSFVGNNAAYYDYDLLHTNGVKSYQGFGPASYSTDVLRRLATRFISNTPSSRPFFLYFAPYAPHDPATPAPRHRTLPTPLRRWASPALLETDLSDKPSWIRSLPPVSVDTINAERVQRYRSLRSVDEAIAAMFDAQRARGRLRNTLVVFLSDNGLMWGEHRVRGKFIPYKGATRVPLAIAWPARLAGGRQAARLALNLDVPVTIADAADAGHDPVAGRSLLRSWSRAGFVLEASRSFIPSTNGTNVARPAYCGWRTPRYLFVHYANGREELYDYAKDPWELRDRSAARPTLRSHLRQLTRAACRPVPTYFHW